LLRWYAGTEDWDKAFEYVRELDIETTFFLIIWGCICFVPRYWGNAGMSDIPDD
jgi:hypothetical protein